MTQEKYAREFVRDVRSFRRGVDSSSLAHHLKRQSFLQIILLSFAAKFPGVSEGKREKFARKAFLGLVWQARRRGKKLEKTLASKSGAESSVDHSTPVAQQHEPVSQLVSKFEIGGRQTFEETGTIPVVLEAENCGTIDLDAGSANPRKIRFASLPADYDNVEDRLVWLDSQAEALSKRFIALLDGRKCLSLDIFDTFLLRNGDSEAERYFKLSEFIIDQLKQDGFVDLVDGISTEGLTLVRTSAMATTYRCRPRLDGAGEGSIADVAAVMAGVLGGGRDLAGRLVDYEVAYEATVLRPNPVLRPVIEAARNSSITIIGLSDMYLPGSAISAICQKVDPDGFSRMDRLFSSADTIVSKRSGKVFAMVETELDLKPEDFLHIGDSFVSDVRNPRSCGWAVAHFPVSQRMQRFRERSLRDVIAKSRDADVDISGWAKV